MDLDLTDKIAIVTGSSRGVGREIALSLANEGANIVVTYNGNEEKAEEVVQKIQAMGRKAICLQVDLGDSKSTLALIEQSITHFGTVDILVNNAAVLPTNQVKDIPLTEWIETLNTNLTSVFLTCQTFVNHCLEQNKPGKILNITSQAAFHGSTTGHAHYASSKAGMLGFTRSLAREVAKKGINVNNLALGIVETDMMKDLIEEKTDYYLNRIPLGRFSTPKDVADIASFLVSERANYITGTTIDASGGMLMH